MRPFPPLQFRRSHERGHVHSDWLDSFHTFSFSSYHDPAHMGFGALRVLNEDRVVPARGFPTHRHRDMEIVSYVLSGELAHSDSLGNGGVIRPGDVQRMTAGTGVSHSEFNPSAVEPVHFLQIWLLPREDGLPPSYEQVHLPVAERRGQLCKLASPDGSGGSVRIQQDATLWVTRLSPGEEVLYEIPRGRHVFVHVARGHVTLNGQAASAGDGARASVPGPILVRGEPAPRADAVAAAADLAAPAGLALAPAPGSDLADPATDDLAEVLIFDLA